MYYERGKHFSKFSFALFLVFCLFMKVLLHEQNKYMCLFFHDIQNNCDTVQILLQS